jgi:hypothetical protein
MTEELKPCPFCGSPIPENTLVYEDKFWTGMQYRVSKATIRHWCAKVGGIEGSFLQVHGKTRQEAIERWNARV